MLTPTRNGILVIFLEKFSHEAKGFKQTTEWGFEIQEDHSDTGQKGRWAKVVACGPEVDPNDIQSGNYVCVEPLMWTPGFTHDGVDIWKTDASKILAVSEQRPI